MFIHNTKNAQQKQNKTKHHTKNNNIQRTKHSMRTTEQQNTIYIYIITKTNKTKTTLISKRNNNIITIYLYTHKHSQIQQTKHPNKTQYKQ